MDPLTKAYLKIITESDDLQKGQDVKGETSQTGKVFGNAESEKNKTPQKKTGPEAVDSDCETPEEAPDHLTQSAKTDGKPAANKVSYEAKNPFDLLYNKILSEEGEEVSFASTPEDSSFGIAEPFGGDSSSEETDEFGEGEEDEDEESEVTFTLPKEIAQKLHDVLMTVLGGEEGGEGEEESEYDFGGSEEGEEESEESEEGDEENPFKEATDMEALSDEKGLTLTSKNNKVSGVNVTKKAATTPATGKGHDGKVKSQPTEGGVSKLTAKAGNKVGSVDKVGSTLFDQ
jgi:hypothetical protein